MADPNWLVGAETFDDAGVYRLAPDLALVQTLDFFPPLVDDPETFGRIAATNALSDVYAMNGRPLTAMNIVAFPDDQLDLSILAAILRGAAEQVTAAGAVVVGGHSVRDAEVKFGLSVTGLVDPAELLTNATARPGDALVLTKPLGTGFVTTAAKKGQCPDPAFAAAVASMTQLNAVGRDALRAADGAHALTDVTGYGLAGHAFELAQGAGVTIRLDTHALPIIDGAAPLAVATFHTRASKTNRAYVAEHLRTEPTIDPVGLEFAFDPQTSGGLLIAIDPAHLDRLQAELHSRGALACAVVGQVLPRDGEIALILA